MKSVLRISIVAAAGLALAVLLMLVGHVAADPPSPVMSAAQPGQAYDSGWKDINPDRMLVFTHNLGVTPTELAVTLWFSGAELGIHHFGYGGLEATAPAPLLSPEWQGAHWQNLTTSTIQVYRQRDDWFVDQVRIRVSVPATDPDYDSGWVDIGRGGVITRGEVITIAHGLGITPTELTVGLWFSGTERGIHHFGYGGLAFDGRPGDAREMWGAHWYNLTSNTVQVRRHPDDPPGNIEQVRVLVVRGAPPAYDSLEDLGDWQSIEPGERFTFTHGLNWAPERLLVRAECYSTAFDASVGIHQWFAGGNHDRQQRWQGAHWQELDRDTVVVFRQFNDQVCPQVRVRIWKWGGQLYLPLVVREE